jgi:hypothetical protein
MKVTVSSTSSGWIDVMGAAPVVKTHRGATAYRDRRTSVGEVVAGQGSARARGYAVNQDRPGSISRAAIRVEIREAGEVEPLSRHIRPARLGPPGVTFPS